MEQATARGSPGREDGGEDLAKTGKCRGPGLGSSQASAPAGLQTRMFPPLGLIFSRVDLIFLSSPSYN